MRGINKRLFMIIRGRVLSLKNYERRRDKEEIEIELDS